MWLNWKISPVYYDKKVGTYSTESLLRTDNTKNGGDWRGRKKPQCIILTIG